MTVAFTFAPPAVAAIFKTRSCEEFDDGSSRLREDYSLDCFDPTHTSMLWFTYFMGLFWVPLPLIFLVLLRTHRRELLDLKTRVDPKLDWFRLLFDSYTPACYWYEIWVFAYRFVLTGAVVLFESGSVLQFTVGIFTSVATLAVQVGGRVSSA